jgi:type II secretory pathway component GspD/PulD (secretin)
MRTGTPFQTWAGRARDASRGLGHLLLTAGFVVPMAVFGATWPQVAAAGENISLTVRDTALSEIFEMLARKERTNILLAKGVGGEVSINLYDVPMEVAIHSVAQAAGYVVERRGTSYVVLRPEDGGKNPVSGITSLQTFPVHYSDPETVVSVLRNHLSPYGKITTLAARKLLVVEDQPEFLARIERLLPEIDAMPTQVFIEGKILEVTLSDSEAFGVDWKQLLTVDGEEGSFGTRLLSDPTSAGLFVNLVTPHLQLALDALRSTGRVRTLSTPRLLALENQEASVIVGDRQGFRVTTTINQVTTESIEFLESGVILKVTPSVDKTGRIMMAIHPEVSTGTINDGIPAQTTTEVTTQLVAEDGQTVFIGGLIKNTRNKSRRGVPGLSRIPLLGRLFSRTEDISVKTETVVMITPHVVAEGERELYRDDLAKVDAAEKAARDDAARIQAQLRSPASRGPNGDGGRVPLADGEVVHDGSLTEGSDGF